MPTHEVNLADDNPFSSESEVPLQSEQSRLEKEIEPILKKPRSDSKSTHWCYTEICEKQLDLHLDYQRGVVWTKDKQSGFIDSLFHNFPIPPIIVSVQRTPDGREKRTCIDGKQRLTSIVRFFQGEIPYSDSKLWYQKSAGALDSRHVISDNQRKFFKNICIPIIEYDAISESQEREIFLRVQNGVPLTPAERLSATNGPYPNLIRRTVKVLTDNSLFTDTLTWLKHCNHSTGFRILSQLAFLVYRRSTEEDPDPPTRPIINSWFTETKETQEVDSDLLNGALAVIYDLLPRISRMRPFEFIFAGYLVHLWKHSLSLDQLDRAIKRMQKELSESDRGENGRLNPEGFLSVVRFVETLGVRKGTTITDVVGLNLGRPAWPRPDGLAFGDHRTAQIDKRKSKGRNEPASTKHVVHSPSYVTAVKQDEKRSLAKKRKAVSPSPAPSSDEEDDLPLSIVCPVKKAKNRITSSSELGSSTSALASKTGLPTPPTSSAKLSPSDLPAPHGSTSAQVRKPRLVPVVEVPRLASLMKVHRESLQRKQTPKSTMDGEDAIRSSSSSRDDTLSFSSSLADCINAVALNHMQPVPPNVQPSGALCTRSHAADPSTKRLPTRRAIRAAPLARSSSDSKRVGKERPTPGTGTGTVGRKAVLPSPTTELSSDSEDDLPLTVFCSGEEKAKKGDVTRSSAASSMTRLPPMIMVPVVETTAPERSMKEVHGTPQKNRKRKSPATSKGDQEAQAPPPKRRNLSSSFSSELARSINEASGASVNSREKSTSQLDIRNKISNSKEVEAKAIPSKASPVQVREEPSTARTDSPERVHVGRELSTAVQGQAGKGAAEKTLEKPREKGTGNKGASGQLIGPEQLATVSPEQLMINTGTKAPQECLLSSTTLTTATTEEVSLVRTSTSATSQHPRATARYPVWIPVRSPSPLGPYIDIPSALCSPHQECGFLSSEL